MKVKADYQAMSDENLMELYQRDLSGAFDVLYQRYSGRVFAFLRSKTGSDRVSQDLTQEVFLKLHRSRAQYNQMLPFAPWIFSITRSVFLDSVKKKNLEVLSEPEEFNQMAAPIAVNDDEPAEILQVLPDSQKQAVALRVYDEATFEEIALRLSTTPANARQLFSRGLKRLKTQLSGKD